MISAVLIWWLIITLIGLAALPCVFYIFRRLPDLGYTLARPFGLLAISYLLWLGASVQVIQNNVGGILISILILLIGSGFSIWKLGGFKALTHRLASKSRLIILTEVLFALALISWTVVRAHTVPFRINPTGGEKFMEIAFLNGILNSPSFPPSDPWLSGYGISYYYFGYVMMGILTRLSTLPSEVSFELYDALLFAFTFVGSFGLVFNLISSGKVRNTSFFSTAAWGFLGAVFTAGMGNLLGIIEALQARGWLIPEFLGWLAVPGLEAASVTGTFLPDGDFWWWRSSRILNDLDLFGQPVGANPITEFPFFSFLLGDNHPHVLALPFVLLSISVAYHLFLTAIEGDHLSPIELGVAAVTIGSLVFLNTWDYPIYVFLAVLAWIVGSIIQQKQEIRRIVLKTFGMAAILLGGMILAYFLFFISFSSQAGGILPNVFPPTRLVQYLVMFGPFIFVLTFFLIEVLRGENDSRAYKFSTRRLISWWARLSGVLVVVFSTFLILTGLVLFIDRFRGGSLSMQVLTWLGGLSWWEALLRIIFFRLTNPWLFLLLTTLLTLCAAGIWSSITKIANLHEESIVPLIDPGLLFVKLLILLGLALSFVVEFLYLRDNFGVRMNTVFKFYFQSWICLSLASAYGIWWISTYAIHSMNRIARSVFFIGTALLTLSALTYPILGLWTRTAGFQNPASLDGTSILRQIYPDDFAAIDWLRQNAPPGTVILEAPGRSYEFEGRISAFTGLPTLLGWAYHEAQWRGSYAEQTLREADLGVIYTNSASDQSTSLLQKWKVRYIIVGISETNYLNIICAQPENSCRPERSLAELERSFPVVFSQGTIRIYAVPER